MIIGNNWPLPTDTLFTDSPDTGWPECICSRCGCRIWEDEVTIRGWPEGGKTEYRYHDYCLAVKEEQLK